MIKGVESMLWKDSMRNLKLNPVARMRTIRWRLSKEYNRLSARQNQEIIRAIESTGIPVEHVYADLYFQLHDLIKDDM